MIIFLDIDGVLCTTRVAVANGENGLLAGFDPIAMTFLNRICREYDDMQIVISSTWRIFDGRNRRVFYELFASAGYIDLAKSLHQDWQTSMNMKPGSRGLEINEWLQDHYNPKQYIIIDDDNDFWPSQQDKLVLTDPLNGMTLEHFEKVLELIDQYYKE